MDFLKAKRFYKLRKSKKWNDPDGEDSPLPPCEAPPAVAGDSADAPPAKGKALFVDDANGDADDEDEDDFISGEVKRRLKELRKNAFMVLIPEEESFREEEEEETSSSDWRDAEVADEHPQLGFDALYDQYCERMLFFDKMIAEELKAAGCCNMSSSSPKSVAKKLSSTLRSFSFKRHDDIQVESEIQQAQGDDSYRSLEVAYVAQVSLSWEALHRQYMELSQKISSQTEDSTCYGYAAQAVQQFQVILQRFVESEPFDLGPRVDIYTQNRISLPKLLQVPNIQASNTKKQEVLDMDPPLCALDLLEVLEESILTFRQFLKMDKRKSGGSLNLFKGNDHVASSLQQVQTSLDKKEMKVKELMRRKKKKKKKGWKKGWPKSPEEVQLLFALVDIKVVSRALRMARISKEQLLWCEEKMSKLELAESKLCRDETPVLFPC